MNDVTDWQLIPFNHNLTSMKALSIHFMFKFLNFSNSHKEKIFQMLLKIIVEGGFNGSTSDVRDFTWVEGSKKKL